MILILELKRILWELLISPEFFLSLFQNNLDNDTFIVEKFPYRRRNNLIVIFRGLQFLLERKFEIVMEEYLPDITNNMIMCLIRAGTVLIRSEIWKFFLTARNGYTREVIKTFQNQVKKIKKIILFFKMNRFKV